MYFNGCLVSATLNRLTVILNGCSKCRGRICRLSNLHISHPTGREYFEPSAKFSKLGKAVISELPGRAL